MLCSQRAERATDCKQCKEAKASQEYSGKNSHCVSEYILDAKAASIYALRFKSEQCYALLAKSRACDRLQTVQRSESFTGIQWEEFSLYF